MIGNDNYKHRTLGFRNKNIIIIIVIINVICNENNIIVINIRVITKEIIA
jgi:hypothetical protein